MRYQRFTLRLLLCVLAALIAGLVFGPGSTPLEPVRAALSSLYLSNFGAGPSGYLVLSVLYFTLGTLVRVPVDVLLFTTCLLIPPPFGWGLALFGLTTTGLLLYAAGAIYGPGQREKDIRRLLPHLHPEQVGGFWANFLLHLSVISPFSVIAYRAGRMRSSLKWFVSGALLGQIFRLPAVAILAGAVELYLWSPFSWRLGLLLAAGAVVYLVFHSLIRRLLPIWTYRVERRLQNRPRIRWRRKRKWRAKRQAS